MEVATGQCKRSCNRSFQGSVGEQACITFWEIQEYVYTFSRLQYVTTDRRGDQNILLN